MSTLKPNGVSYNGRTVVGYSGPATDIDLDGEAIRSFLSWWFESCTRGRIEIGWKGRAGGLNNFRRFKIGDEAIVRAVIEANMVPGQCVYFRAATVGTLDGGFTADADFVEAPGAWGDIDTPEQLERARNVQTLVRPNGSVITGRTPNLRLQHYYRADKPICDPELLKSLNRRVYCLFSGDPTVVNPTRLMRMPGTIAWPWKQGRVPEMTEFRKGDASRPSAYPIEELTGRLPDEKEVHREASPRGEEVPPSTVTGATRVSACLQHIRAGQHWHDSMVRLVAHWVGRGLADIEILAFCEHITLAPYTVAQTVAEVTKAIEGARRKWNIANEEPIVTDAFASPFVDRVFDPWDTLAPPEFPHEALPGVLQDFVLERARVMGADPCALAWSSLSACSAALDGQIRLRMKKHDGWFVPPSIWVALLGPSSSKKSPIIQATWAQLEHRQQIAMRAYAEELRRWNALSEDEQKDIAPPAKPRRLVSHDATTEAFQDILKDQSCGIGYLRDELAGFIGSLDKYKGGGKGGAADRAFYLQAYNGGPFVVDRVARGTVPVDNLLITLCGGIQPARLAEFSNLADDGLWQRFVPIIVPSAQMGVDEASGKGTVHYQRLIDRLLDRAYLVAAFSEAAHEIRELFETEIFDLERSAPLGGKFASFCGKLQGLFGRLSLVLCCVDQHAGPAVVSEAHARAARTLIKHSAIPHAARVYATMGDGEASAETTKYIAGYILSKRLHRLLASDLTRSVRICRGKTLTDVQRAVSPLVAGGWLVPEKEHGGNNAWKVNPRVHHVYAERAHIEVERRARAHNLITGEQDESE